MIKRMSPAVQLASTPNRWVAEIGDYGFLANDHTSALAGRDGSIGWWCVPRFDSPSVFGSILDADRGGTCSIRPSQLTNSWQSYWSNTNILQTDLQAQEGKLRLLDWLPFSLASAHEAQKQPGPEMEDDWAGKLAGTLCRRYEVVDGEVELEIRCEPRFNYGKEAARWEPLPGQGYRAQCGEAQLYVYWSGGGNVSSLTMEDGVLQARLRLRAGESGWLVLNWGEALECDQERVHQWLEQTRGAWQEWVSQGDFPEGEWKDHLVRSALVLKGLVYEPSGAIVAAPTTSLPEQIGGPRNWDYRFCWPRDASFALYGLSLLGYHEVTERFLRFIVKLTDRHPLPLQVCYRIDGDADLPEQELPYLSGFQNSRPVRVGNGAAAQYQLDIYGETLDAAYTFAKWRKGLPEDLWPGLCALADYACQHWREPDNGIWEVRGGRQHFVYSKVMCWVALDRALKLAQRHGFKAPLQRWQKEAASIHDTVYQEGFSSRRQAFSQSLGSDVLDASVLLMPLVRFLKPCDPRMISTLRAVEQSLAQGPLVSRYENTEDDGVGGDEGAFSICSFWRIDCLTLAGEGDRARQLLGEMLTYCNELKLFSEEIEVNPGKPTRLLGNFPQAFTHMALINSAHNLMLYPKGVAEQQAHQLQHGS